MVEIDDILKFVDGVATKVRPQRIVLFGSYAYGTPTEDSDVDLLIIMNYRGDNADKSAKIRGLVPRPFPMDLLVRNESEIKRRIAGNDFFLKEVIEKGLVLYDAHDIRMGSQGRRRLRRHLSTVAVA
jgi:predicted nucleotidyltransferase